MLVSAHIAGSPSVKRLVQIWADRYKLNFSLLTMEQNPLIYTELVKASSLAGRAATAAKLDEYLIDFNCQLAAVRARSLYEYVPSVLHLSEARRLTQYVSQVYRKLLEVYQTVSAEAASPIQRLGSTEGGPPLSAWGIPNIEELASAIEPVLLELQTQHTTSRDWRTLGFLTTQFNFSNHLLMERLTPAEQILVGPYFKFVEEQAALPWQRVCAAAVQHELTSPAFALVEQLLPEASDIASTVYQRLVKQFSTHQSRRGKLDNPSVTHSCLRDLQMFQAYLWVSVLQEDLHLVEEELVPLCVMVMESVEVKWELIEQWTQELMTEILSRLSFQQQALLLPYCQATQEAFYRKRLHLGAALP